MDKINEKRKLMIKNYEEIAKEAKLKRQKEHEIYLEEMKNLDNQIKEKEKNAKLEIEKIKRDNKEIIRKAQENSRLEIEKFSKELELKYQEKINENIDKINAIMKEYQEFVNRLFGGN